MKKIKKSITALGVAMVSFFLKAKAQMDTSPFYDEPYQLQGVAPYPSIDPIPSRERIFHIIKRVLIFVPFVVGIIKFIKIRRIEDKEQRNKKGRKIIIITLVLMALIAAILAFAWAWLTKAGVI